MAIWHGHYSAFQHSSKWARWTKSMSGEFLGLNGSKSLKKTLHHWNKTFCKVTPTIIGLALPSSQRGNKIICHLTHFLHFSFHRLPLCDRLFHPNSSETECLPVVCQRGAVPLQCAWWHRGRCLEPYHVQGAGWHVWRQLSRPQCDRVSAGLFQYCRQGWDGGPITAALRQNTSGAQLAMRSSGRARAKTCLLTFRCCHSLLLENVPT